MRLAQLLLGAALLLASCLDARCERASWYGPGQGPVTATGERFDPDGLTAASRTLPFGTCLVVWHKGRGVTVVVNDRGPFVRGRDLDLSRGAARAIGLDGPGVAEVRVERCRLLRD